MATLKLHSIESGSPEKPAIIFLHGFPFDLTMWEMQAELCRPHFRVMTYDQRGHGQSPAATTPYTFESLVDDLMGLMDQWKIDKAILCGLSMGGYVALRTAERHPERVQALILSDTRSEADSDAAKLKRAADLNLIQSEGLGTFAEKFLKNVFTPAHYSSQPKLVDSVRRMILTGPKTGAEATLVAMATRTDTTASLAKIQVPTLILVGEEDIITPPAAAADLHKRIAKSVMATIPAAGHLSNLENPTDFNTHLLGFLKQFSA